MALAVLAAFDRAAGQTADATAGDGKALPATIVIFDGSGSMWGKLEGARLTKLVDARDAVKQAVAKIKPQSTALGLMSFGHRRAADCSDVQLIAAPEVGVPPAFTDRIAGPLDKLNPKGKGPLTAALREAAKVVGKSAGPRSLVLIHDDPDNCQQDACAALDELQQAAPGVVIHVVGLGLKGEDATRYQCLTKPTGGRHVDAQDPTQIANGIGEVMQLASLGLRDGGAAPVSAAMTSAAVAAPTIVKPEPVNLAKDGPPTLRLRALATKDRPIAGHGVKWTVVREAQGGGDPPATNASGGDVVLPMPQGTYLVRAEAAFVSAQTTVTVGAQGQSLAEVNFDAGELRLRSALAADVTVIISERKADAPSPIGIWPRGQAAILVPAKPLTLSVEQGELRTEKKPNIVAGEGQDIDLTVPGGRVLLDIASAAGPAAGSNGSTAVQPVVFTIEEDDPDAPKGRREIARSAAQSAEFVVAPGTYLVAATRGAFSARERITVTPGEAVKRSLPLVAARMVISARLGAARSAEGTQGASGDTASDSFQLVRLDADGETGVGLAGPAAIIDVPPGRYRVEARRNNAAIKAEQIVEIRAGEFRPVTLEYQAGLLRMELIAKNDEAAENLAWHVIDSNGRLVWSGYEPAPSALFDAGRYVVRLLTRAGKRDVAAEIKTGEITTVRLEQPK